MKVLVTGAAGFIGYHLSRRFIRDGYEVTGVDNLNAYYDVNLKKARLKELEGEKNFVFRLMALEDRGAVSGFFAGEKFDYVLNMAAQPGVRYSLVNPYSYIDSNIAGFLNVLEGCRQGSVKHLVFASSSSVYGLNTRMPLSVHDNVDHPISLYAATKKANELMAHTYSYLYGLPTTGLRFFTVYGPWGRPDMVPIKFTEAILAGRAIDVYNYGKCKRDFTYIDDIVEGVVRVMMKIPPAKNPSWDSGNPDPASSGAAPYRLFNIGNNDSVELLRFIEVLEEKLGKKAKMNLLPLPPGDVPVTYADVEDLTEEVGFRPRTSIEEGLGRFVDWYKSYYGLTRPSE
jgi:UDP-glucuronate 4-epimerase